MSKFSDALHKVFGFVKVKEPEVEAILKKGEADAKAVLDKAKKDAEAAKSSKAASDLKAALDTVVKAVTDSFKLPPPTPPTATA